MHTIALSLLAVATAQPPGPEDRASLRSQADPERFSLRSRVDPGDAQIREALLQGAHHLSHCYDHGPRTHEVLEGRVELGWTIEPDGTAHDVFVRSSTLSRPEVGACLALRIEALRFPRRSEPTQVAWPFVFAPGAPPPDPPSPDSAQPGRFELDPVPRVDPTRAGPPRWALPQAVQAHVAARSHQLHRCLGPNTPAGPLWISWTLAADGTVHDVRVTSGEGGGVIHDPQLVSCLSQQVEGWRLEPSGSAIEIRWPLLTDPQRPGAQR